MLQHGGSVDLVHLTRQLLLKKGQVYIVLVRRPGQAASDDVVHRGIGTEQKPLTNTPVRQKIEGIRGLMSYLSRHVR